MADADDRFLELFRAHPDLRIAESATRVTGSSDRYGLYAVLNLHTRPYLDRAVPHLEEGWSPSSSSAREEWILLDQEALESLVQQVEILNRNP